MEVDGRLSLVLIRGSVPWVCRGLLEHAAVFEVGDAGLGRFGRGGVGGEAFLVEAGFSAAFVAVPEDEEED